MCGKYWGSIFSLGIMLKVWRFGDFLGVWVQVGHFGGVVIWGRILEFGNVAV